MTDDDDERRAILERLATYDAATLRRLAALLEGPVEGGREEGGGAYLAFLRPVAASDVAGLVRAEQSYGDSWKRRGGVDAFAMLTRKWDRIEKRLAEPIPSVNGAPGASRYDIFEHLAADARAEGLIDDIRDLRRYLMLVDAETLARQASGAPDSGRGFLAHLQAVADSDVREVEEKEKAYGASWKRRGGIAAFMMLARKWDRIDARVRTEIPPAGDAPGAGRDNILEHIAADRRTEGVLEDIRDLRRYLLLVEAEMAARGAVEVGSARDNRGQG